LATPAPRTLAARRAGPDYTEDRAHHTLMSLFVFTLRTTPGLVLIAVGAGVTLVGHPWAGLAVAAVGGLVYRVQCYRTPYTDCWRCGGIGYRPPRHRRHGIGRLLLAVIFGGASGMRRCRACRGRGVRMRWGKRAMNVYRRATYTGPALAADAAPEPRPPLEAGPVSYEDVLRTWHDNHPGH
jgi:GNAT superfamily N-acetyltransferase